MAYTKSVRTFGARKQPVAPTGFEWKSGTVTEVTDGDTLQFLADGKIHTLRLAGIDTPELGKKDARNEFFALEAKKFLTSLVVQKPLTAFLSTAPVTYKRKLGYLFTPGGLSINEQLVAGGYAFASRGFSFPEQAHYIDLETQARAEKRGMWRDPPKVASRFQDLLLDMSGI